MNRAASRLKEALLTVSSLTGVTSLVRDSKWRSQRLLILCYHGVSQDDEHLWNGALYVSQDHLRRRLEWLRANRYAILPLNEALERMHSGTLPARSVALTFDDGAVDFQTRALPVLEEFDAPAMLYLTTYYVEQRLPVFDTMLSYLLWKGSAVRADLDFLGDPESLIDTRSGAGRVSACLAVRSWAASNDLGTVSKDNLLRTIAAGIGVDYEALCEKDLLKLMSASSNKQLPPDLIDIQLHTHRHRTPRDEVLFAQELADNSKAIANMGLESVLTHFCYPSGEYFGEYLSWLPQGGVKYATMCVPGLTSVDSHPLLLPRFIDTTSTSDVVFEAWASGIAQLIPRRAEHRIQSSRL